MDETDYVIKSYEPMDLDLSHNSVKNSDTSGAASDIYCKQEHITVIDSTINASSCKFIKQEPVADSDGCANVKNFTSHDPVKWNIKKFRISLHRDKKQSPFLPVNLRILGILMVFVSIIVFFIIKVKCNNELAINEIERTLSKNIYGQIAAVEKIVQALNKQSQSKVLFFYGGTGVGKTYAASLITQDILNCSNVYHFTMPTFRETFSTNLLFGLYMCKSTIIVIDNLNPDDMNVSSLINEVVEKSNRLGKVVTIILIFNCDMVTGEFVKKCEASFPEQILKNFNQILVLKVLVKFNTLTEETLVKCIEKELPSINLENDKLNNLLKHFDVTSDGCKGVHSKIKFLNMPRE